MHVGFLFVDTTSKLSRTIKWETCVAALVVMCTYRSMYLGLAMCVLFNVIIVHTINLLSVFCNFCYMVGCRGTGWQVFRSCDVAVSYSGLAVGGKISLRFWHCAAWLRYRQWIVQGWFRSCAGGRWQAEYLYCVCVSVAVCVRLVYWDGWMINTWYFEPGAANICIFVTAERPVVLIWWFLRRAPWSLWCVESSRARCAFTWQCRMPVVLSLVWLFWIFIKVFSSRVALWWVSCE